MPRCARHPFGAHFVRPNRLCRFVEQSPCGRHSSNSCEAEKEKGPPMGTLCLFLARPERFELPTARFVAEYSIQLSYGRIVCYFRLANKFGGERGIDSLVPLAHPSGALRASKSASPICRTLLPVSRVRILPVFINIWTLIEGPNINVAEREGFEPSKGY